MASSSATREHACCLLGVVFVIVTVQRCVPLQVIGLGEINLEDAEFMMRPRTVTEVEVQLQKADPSIDVMKLVKARAHHAACGCLADMPMHDALPKSLERW